MRVLLTNDDGGPNDLASPYIKFLVSAIIKYTNWDLTICVPFSQKSWIGKAHFAGKDVTAKYIYSSISKPEDNSFHGPFPFPQKKFQENSDLKEWCLIDNGTPATCTDIGVNHICGGTDNVDLVISGPNVGRNSTALYALSSGTVGGAMEGCHQGKRSIAISYSYEVNPEVPAEWLSEASLLAVKVVQELWDSWKENDQTQIYNVNIPLNENVKLGKTKIYHVPMLENKWGKSLYYKEAPKTSNSDEHVDIVDSSIADGIVFKWKPDFVMVHKAVDHSAGFTDGKAIRDGHVSITALRANFRHVDEENHGGEMILKGDQ
jgi:tubulin---tyrosine ligase